MVLAGCSGTEDPDWSANVAASVATTPLAGVTGGEPWELSFAEADAELSNDSELLSRRPADGSEYLCIWSRASVSGRRPVARCAERRAPALAKPPLAGANLDDDLEPRIVGSAQDGAKASGRTKRADRPRMDRTRAFRPTRGLSWQFGGRVIHLGRAAFLASARALSREAAARVVCRRSAPAPRDGCRLPGRA